MAKTLAIERPKKPIGGWRLPAATLEDAVAHSITEWMSNDKLPAMLLFDAAADEQVRLQRHIGKLKDALAAADDPIIQLAPLIDRIDLLPGTLTVRLDARSIAKTFETTIDCIDPDAIMITVPFDQRRRGVETKMLLGDAPLNIDPMLVRNVAIARASYADLKEGASFADVAACNSMTVPILRRILPLAFLAPSIVEAICTGRQPIELTSRKLRDIEIPSCWNAQDKLFDIA